MPLFLGATTENGQFDEANARFMCSNDHRARR